MRVAEMRELAGQISPLENETFRIIGTRGSFSENVWYYNGRTNETDAIRPEQRTRYTDAELFDPLPPEVREAFLTVQNRSSGDLQNRDFVPQGHGGSHPYLVHEFVTSVYERRQPLVNAMGGRPLYGDGHGRQPFRPPRRRTDSGSGLGIRTRILIFLPIFPS